MKVYYEEPILSNIIGLATQITDETDNTYSLDAIIDLINNNRYTAKAIKKIANNKFQVLLEEIVEEVFEEESHTFFCGGNRDDCAQKDGYHESGNTNEPRSFGIVIRSFY